MARRRRGIMITDTLDVLGLSPTEAGNMIASINKSKAISDQFSYRDGGLITGVILDLHEPEPNPNNPEPATTAGLAGIQGPLKDQPAFWAGGAYGDAIAGEAKAIIRHDGSSKFTDTDITGKITATKGLIGGFDIANKRLSTNSAGSSGDDGDGYLPSHWSGGSYEEAVAFGTFIKAFENNESLPTSSMANFVVLHNGYTKIGSNYIQPNGTMFLLNELGETSVIISNQEIPTIEDLYNGTPSTQTINNNAVSGIAVEYDSSVEYTLPNKIILAKDHSVIEITTQLTLTRTSTHSPTRPIWEEENNFIIARLYLKKEGEFLPYNSFANASVRFAAPNYDTSLDVVPVNVTLRNLSKGTYSIVLRLSSQGAIEATASLTSTVMKAFYNTDLDNTIHIGRNGIAMKYGNNVFHQGPGGLYVYGDVQIPYPQPPIPVSGRVSYDGQLLSYLGDNPPIIERLGIGIYKINHYLGSLTYCISLAVESDTSYISYRDVDYNEFEVIIMGDNGSRTDKNFHFTIMH